MMRLIIHKLLKCKEMVIKTRGPRTAQQGNEKWALISSAVCERWGDGDRGNNRLLMMRRVIVYNSYSRARLMKIAVPVVYVARRRRGGVGSKENMLTSVPVYPPPHPSPLRQKKRACSCLGKKQQERRLGWGIVWTLKLHDR
jgi:hypothetical protein